MTHHGDLDLAMLPRRERRLVERPPEPGSGRRISQRASLTFVIASGNSQEPPPA